MNFRIILVLILVCFCLFCGLLVFQSGLFESCRTKGGAPCILLQQGTMNPSNLTEASGSPDESPQANDFTSFTADNAPAGSVTLGSVDPKSGFKFRLDLSTKGAGIERATFSGFDDRDHEDPQPLEILTPVQLSAGDILSMANTNFVFVDQKLQLPLDRLHWKSYDVEKGYDGSQTARFEAILKTSAGEPVIKLTKTYRVTLDSYLLDCDLTVENIAESEQKVRFNLVGPVGLGREDFRADMRKAVAGFRDSQGNVTPARLDLKKLSKAKTAEARRLSRPGANFLWAAATNKYFAAILVPLPDEGKDYCDWVADRTGRFYNPDGYPDTGDEAVGVDLKIASAKLAPAAQTDGTRTYKFQLYLGPKDKSLFDKNEMYRNLGFVQTIDFLACCCPAAIIQPLAFGILTLMRWGYGFIHNYGVVIIILVFIIRIVIHPLTKKSQVSMSKMSKLAPMAEQIKKKYANNKAEMNKHLMALYREQGASPVMGMLPMMVQMPIWIALYSAIYASIELRGAPFLPVWITDLSAPDALVRFATITVPLLGWKIDSFNLLPILMGVVFYLQQKLMPKPEAAAANPQVAQQQKMMMIMMPLLFPLILYKAPSGLNLYILASTCAGVIEQYVIRKHIREKEEAEAKGLVAATSKTGGKVKKKKPKPFYRLP
ncbi:MAG: YidC/Oxa1 family insertase periplasmic-domain containing protein [Planctomycetota bacterium]|nr:MAG: YidC/Oxa1 family insertase periplasmic-domain containing protein [Planctomycetota bacterium]